MELTKDETKKEIFETLRELVSKSKDGKINPSQILDKLDWEKDKIKEVYELFGVAKFTEVLKQFSEIECTKNDGGTAYVFLSKNKAITENETMTKQEQIREEKAAENLHERIEKLLEALNSGLYEKEEAVRLALLTAVAGESIFFLGAPGCAKSMIARRISKAFKADGENPVTYFEYLMNQFSTPEDLFGNISLKALNGELDDSNGKEEYRRLTDGFLPKADIAFLDEIWKSSPAILNSLLTIINERKFHNGSKIESVPLKALFTASNELPAKNQGLEALYDRFILRLPVCAIENEGSFLDMIDQPSSEFELSDEQKKLLISNKELEEWKKQIDDVSLSEEAKDVISAIRKELTDRNEKLSDEEKQNGELFEVGDRRWKKIARILKTSAFLNGRTEADLMDCQLIEYCIWNTEEQREKAREIVEACIKQNGLDCDTAIGDINEQIVNFKTKVEDTWFTKVQKDKTVVIEGQECYECTRQGTNETWYVTVSGGTHYSNNYHDIYNSNKVYENYGTFTKDGDTISCRQTFIVIKKTVLQKNKFSDIKQETMQKNFDKEYYASIVDKINAEIDSLKQRIKTDEIPFKANLFANQEYNKSITAKLEDAIKELQDAKVNLDKQHDRYFNSSLSAALSVGDVILKNGIVVSAGEVNSLSTEDKDNVVAVVCIADEKTYAIGLEEKAMKWNEIHEFALHYGDNLPKDYASGWTVPDKDLLNKIWKNCNTVNESLEAINEKLRLVLKEYWSSSQNGDSAAFYQLFDGRGHQDHTTADHEYAVRAIREWSK